MLRRVARRAEAGYRALLVEHARQGVVGMRPERPEPAIRELAAGLAHQGVPA